MYCQNCGAKNSGESRFCNRCGNALGAPEEANPAAQAPSGPETIPDSAEAEPAPAAGPEVPCATEDKPPTEDVGPKGKKKKPTVLIVCIAAAIVLVGAVAAFLALSNGLGGDRVGNTYGNIANFGMVAGQGNWIYYSANQYDGNSDKLYKVSADKQRATLDNKDAIYINVSGNWIYYSEKGTGSLYRIGTDGKGQKLLTDDNGINLNVVGDWIYYCAVTGDDYLEGSIYKIRTDGTERTELCNDKAKDINISGNWIYYINSSNSDMIYKIRTDGTGKRLVRDIFAFKMQVSDGWIYFLNKDNRLSRMRLDGSEMTLLNQTEGAFVFNISGDWIYYATYDDGMHKVRTDGTGETLLCPNDVYAVNIVDNWIYCYGTPLYFKIRTDGTGYQTYS